MNILLICNKSPWPKTDGGAIGLYVMITGLLKAGHKVKVLAANTNKNWVDINSIPEEFRKSIDIELIPLNLSLNPFSAFYNLISNKSYHVTRFYSKEFENKIIEILKKDHYDIVQLEYLPMALYINAVRQYSKSPIVLRNHNIEHIIWERIATNTKQPLKRFYLKKLSETLKSFEIKSMKSVDGIISVTQHDADNFKKMTSKKHIISIPTGLTKEQLPEKSTQIPDNHFFHIGAMNWQPNLEGVKWLIDDIFPKVKLKCPDAVLHLAGRYMPDWLQNLQQDGIIVDGEVPDVFDYMNKHGIMVVPLLSGSGIRIKIIEGMAANKPIITTTIGAEGINCKHNSELLLADSAEDFANEMIRLRDDLELRNKLSENARQLIEKEHSSEMLIEKLEVFYKNLITEKQQ